MSPSHKKPWITRINRVMTVGAAGAVFVRPIQLFSFLRSHSTFDVQRRVSGLSFPGFGPCNPVIL
jgi:hypothetical protein